MRSGIKNGQNKSCVIVLLVLKESLRRVFSPSLIKSVFKPTVDIKSANKPLSAQLNLFFSFLPAFLLP
jgi:hypothetical protein